MQVRTTYGSCLPKYTKHLKHNMEYHVNTTNNKRDIVLKDESFQGSNVKKIN